MNDLEIEIEYLLGWYSLKRRYNTGLALTVIGAFVLIVKLIVLTFIPNYIAYQNDVLVYNGNLIRLYIGMIMGGIGGSLLLIGIPLLIIYAKKRNDLGIAARTRIEKKDPVFKTK